ncbi:hypothetical protein M0R72_09885 [Candidatus Pacearchaeota archaeon]|jgi:hypothetical protein|nr:hypothetical protein [Candidatus Pacearchaeota archaeon]
MNKIIPVLIILVLNFTFIYATNYPSSLSIGSSANVAVVNGVSTGSGSVITSEEIVSIDTTSERTWLTCEGCLRGGKCYNIGTRLTIEPEYPKKDLAWRNITFLYCDEGKPSFVAQKITRESCENDFECQSNSCINYLCEQKIGINVIEIRKDEDVVVKELLFREKEIFYFSSLVNYSIGFGREDEGNFIFLINNITIPLENKTFVLENNSKFIFNKISFENGIAKANVTLIENKNFANDSIKFTDDTAYLENNSTKIPSEGTLQITGNVVDDKQENIFNKFLNFLKNLF